MLARYLGGLRRIVGDRRLVEFTVEANPGSLTPAKVRALVEAGVTRVSLGAQSFEPDLLVTLGRAHGPDDVPRSIDALRAGGIEHLSVDLILAVPGQSLAAQTRDAEKALSLGTEHLSAYVLTYEEGTSFTRWMREGRLPRPDEDRELEHQQVIRERFEGAGYLRYEISNYARAGRECQHNLGYWRDANWMALGAGAHGHVNGRRWKNVSDPAAYVRRIVAGEGAEEWAESLDARTRLSDALMMGLRLVEGVDLDLIARRTGLDPRRACADVLARHERDGLLTLRGSRLIPTDRGLDLASFVARSLLPD